MPAGNSGGAGAGFTARLAEVEQAKEALRDPRRAAGIARQHARGKRSARERVAYLFDEGSFDETGMLVSERDRSSADAPADGVITGTGRIHGRWACVIAQDFTVMGGSIGDLGSLKFARMAEQSLALGIPLIMLMDGGGHRIQGGQDSWHFARGGDIFLKMARMSGWVPIVTAIMGDGFAAATNFAGLSDFVVMVRGTSTMGIAGPLLVKAATGEDVSKEELGGARAQVDRFGLAHLGVDSEEDALDTIKRYLSYLPSNARAEAPVAPTDDPSGRTCDAFVEMVPTDTRKPYDIRKVIGEVADRDSVFEIQPGYAGNAVTAFGRLDGRAVGFVANQPLRLGGMLTSPACEKIAHFVAVCDAFGLPLVYLIDVPGFSVGTAAEESKLGRRSARMLYELGHCTVPRVSLVLRKGYGLGYYAMCGGRGFASDASLAWPTAEICAMSIDGSVDVAYRKDYLAAVDAAARRQELIDAMRADVNPLRAAGGFGVGDIIDPRDSRRRLIDVLSRAPGRRDNPMPAKYRSISPI